MCLWFLLFLLSEFVAKFSISNRPCASSNVKITDALVLFRSKVASLFLNCLVRFLLWVTFLWEQGDPLMPTCRTFSSPSGKFLKNQVQHGQLPSLFSIHARATPQWTIMLFSFTLWLQYLPQKTKPYRQPSGKVLQVILKMSWVVKISKPPWMNFLLFRSYQLQFSL